MSNLVVKMMSNENIPDSDPGKGFTIIEAYGEVRCSRSESGEPLIVIPLECGQLSLHHPEGNSYIIKNGKTVATFNYDPRIKLERIKSEQAVEIIKGLIDDFNEYANKALYITGDEEFRKLSEQEKTPYLLVDRDRLAHIFKTHKWVAGGDYRYIKDVIHPDAKVVFQVYGLVEKITL